MKQPDQVQTLQLDDQPFRLPFADLLPDLTPDEFAELKADIKERGVQVPIMLAVAGDDGNVTTYDVIDGQHRLKAAADLGIAFDDLRWQLVTGTPEELAALAFDLNVKRRQLTKEQRDHAAVTLRQAGLSYRKIAQKLNVSTETARRAVLDSADQVPDTITGADGKKYAAVDENAQMKRACRFVLDLMESGETVSTASLESNTGFSRIGIAPRRVLSVLVGDRKIKPAGNGAYSLAEDRQKVRMSLINDVLRNQLHNGPVLMPDLRNQCRGIAELAEYDHFKPAIDKMISDGSVYVEDGDHGLLVAHKSYTPPSDELKAEIVAVLQAGPLTHDQLISTLADRSDPLMGEFNLAVLELYRKHVIEYTYDTARKKVITLTGQPDGSDHQVPTETDYKRVRAAIRHTLVDNATLRPDREFITIDDLTYRLGDYGYTADQLRQLCADLVTRGTLIETPDGWQPAPSQPADDRQASQDRTDSSTPQRANSDSAPLYRRVSLDTAREFVIEQFRKSQRPLTAGEISNWAKLDPEQTRAALQAMHAAGNIGLIADRRGGFAYHYPHVLAATMIKIAQQLPDQVNENTNLNQLLNADYSVLEPDQVAAVQKSLHESITALQTVITSLSTLDRQLAGQNVNAG